MFQKATPEVKEAQRRLVEGIDGEWGLVSAGTRERGWNTMTIGWADTGTLWSTPVVTVFVHPRRYTHEFLLREDHFCVSLFDRAFRPDLAILGSRSGRDTDKVALTSLTPRYLEEGVSFEEAHTTLVCRKVYTHAMDLSAVPDQVRSRLGSLYEREAHTVFVGEICRVC